LPGVHVFKVAYCDGINMKQFTASEAGKSDEIKGSYKTALRIYINALSLMSVLLMFKSVYYLFISCTYSNFLTNVCSSKLYSLNCNYAYV